jgi:uncharacterized membrane protein YjfL (UPF0719 family)
MNLPANLLSDVVVTLIFGAVAIFLLILAIKAWDLMTRKIDEEEQLNKNNHSVAVVMSAYMLSVAYIIGQVVAHVLGG